MQKNLGYQRSVSRLYGYCPWRDIGIIMSDEFEVEKILAFKKRKGKTFYKVRWKTFGPEHDTWEPVNHLRGCKELVQEFESAKLAQGESEPSPLIRRSGSNAVARTPRTTTTKTNISLPKSAGGDGDRLNVRERVEYTRHSLQRSALRGRLPIQDTPKVTLTDGFHIKRTAVTTKIVNKEVSAKIKQEDASMSPALAVLCVLLIFLVLVFVYFSS